MAGRLDPLKDLLRRGTSQRTSEDGVATGRHYLFVTGCPRSGTSITRALLLAHSAVAIASERYGLKVLHDGRVGPELFERSRFFNFEAGDTFYDRSTFDVDQVLSRRWESATYVGDKLPFLYRILPSVLETFGPDVRIVFMVRNVIDVAASYQHRAADEADKTWSRTQGPAAAVEDWNESVAAGLRHIRDPRVLCVQYERLLQAGTGLDELFGFLGLEVEEPVRERYHEVIASSGRLEAGRKRDLGFEDIDRILRRADIARYRQILASGALALAEPDAVTSPV